MSDVREKHVPRAWRAEIESWTTALQAASCTAQTIETRTDHIRRLARAMEPTPPWEVTSEALTQWAGAQHWARETRRSVYSSIRRFYAWGVQTERVSESPAQTLPSVRPAPPCPRPAPEGVYRQALARADLRSRVIVRLAAEAGLRRAEIAQVSRRDVMADLGGFSLLVHGKGGKERIVPLSPMLAREMSLLFDRTPVTVERWLFPSPKSCAGHLTPRHVGKLASAVLPDAWTLHPLRHRFATRSYAVDRDLIAVQTLLGHASVATTQRYVRPPDDAVRRAAGGAWADAA